ncbi:MAG TPA: hypothetical protein DDZ80_05725 [Cyanobacteria bacterium UBA8803]|nr:hypothetical protein [Cyanobacteria bacterium UBA9273]HBL58036.1 hypothetical protein [Cyanobacteria bacterium UBA8803]
MQSEQLQQIMGYYIKESQKNLAVIEQYLLNLQGTVQDSAMVDDLFRAARCGIVGGANLLPISNLHISCIHKTALCLVDCCQVFQQQGAFEVDQKLEDLLMEVFYTLQGLIEKLREPSRLTDDEAEQIISQIEPLEKSLMAHLHGLLKRSHRTQLVNAIASEEADELASLADLESLIDSLALDNP